LPPCRAFDAVHLGAELRRFEAGSALSLGAIKACRRNRKLMGSGKNRIGEVFFGKCFPIFFPFFFSFFFLFVVLLLSNFQ